jgi:hypothetical protein
MHEWLPFAGIALALWSALLVIFVFMKWRVAKLLRLEEPPMPHARGVELPLQLDAADRLERLPPDEIPLSN